MYHPIGVFANPGSTCFTVHITVKAAFSAYSVWQIEAGWETMAGL